MLQYSTVEPGTLDLLRRLMSINELSDFFLVGGTALSLYFGHRLSIDLDLFSATPFETTEVIPILESAFPGFSYRNINSTIGLFSFIDGVKVDFVKYHQYKFIEPPQLVDGLRLMSIPDIAAMKIAAILKRGVKKDFYDISELLNHYTINDLIGFYNRKFPNQQLLISIPQALTYFEDANESEAPISLKNKTWPQVKKHINKKANEYLM